MTPTEKPSQEAMRKAREFIAEYLGGVISFEPTEMIHSFALALDAFASQAAERERKECAKVAEEYLPFSTTLGREQASYHAKKIAAAIRSRSDRARGKA